MNSKTKMKKKFFYLYLNLGYTFLVQLKNLKT